MKIEYVLFAMFLISLTACSLKKETSNVSFNVGGLRVDKTLKSIDTFRKEGVIMQKYDFSCGAASVATLLKYSLNRNVTEKEVLEKIRKFYVNKPDELEKAKRFGFSLKDMEKVIESYGFSAFGVVTNLKYIVKSNVYAIVRFMPDGKPHFAVFSGINNKRLYLKDPAFGNTRMKISKFYKMWDGKALLIRPNDERKINYSKPDFYKDPSESFIEGQMENIRNITTRNGL